jgi:predicted ribosome quality control (RQC) complex YloA/Tae2 family protein
MKKQLTSADIFFLASELNARLSSARIDKAYQLGEKELKLRVYAQGAGSLDLVAAPDYLCVSRFIRKAPEKPSSFAMQLRKNLGGAYIREVRQHGFDRILEFSLEKEEKKFIMVFELFSRGNVLLCNAEGKILGLLEWQKWKDRKLGVGQKYEYPPAAKDPFGIDFPALRKILSSTEKKLVAALATDAGLGGTYAEETCSISGLDKDRPAKDLGNSEMDAVYDAFSEVRKKIIEGPASPQIVYLDKKAHDVVPLELSIYAGYEKKAFNTFNEAVDEYFSREEFAKEQNTAEEKFLKEQKKLEDIEAKQTEILKRFEKEAIEFHETGDMIYQSYGAIEQIINAVKEARSKGFSWEEISEKLSGKELGEIKVSGVGRDGFASLKLKKPDKHI